MLKIHQIFIIKFLVLFVGALLVTSLISYMALRSIIIEHNKNHLEHSIDLMELELDNIENLDKFVAKVHDKTSLRVTILNADGIVIAESNADKESMDNHGSRYEIIKANSNKYADITRYSKTLKVDFLYVAKKININSETIYIRLSMSLAQIMDDFYSLWIKLFFVFIGIILISTFISKKMSERVVYDISQITNYLDEISNKNYNATIKIEYFYEFLQVSLLLKNLVKKLAKNDKKKIKNIAKLRLINKQRNDILSALSHEFKNPIASIVGYAQTIREDADMPPKIRDKFLEKISSNGEKISKMLDRLALSVKLDNGDLAINNSEFDLRELCHEVSLNQSSKYKDRDIIVEADEAVVISDKTMLELVLINLVDNALKYSSGDVKIILKNEKISIQDSGIGIKEEHLDKVTSKFYRVDKNSWDNSMGIGLAMVSYILKSLNSHLEIDSEFAKGSVFSFNIKNMLKS
ncbi:ATP-binding protein [Candidatus Sulfurimonas baltica]|uniref:histidine kinase n=2 Tax=Candidatus Sulfurimonas baltica TaxID=2740404 RepID=A0A7S7LX97_9BACT|nr:ATP-binding protein [Candidatus Sulfurimonas baltica]